MKGDKKVIEFLNQALVGEQTAVHQYLAHSHILRDWGIDKLADFEAGEINDERGHAGKFIQRILFLEGKPEFAKIDKIYIGKNVKEILQNDLKLEMMAVELYRKAAKYCENVGDFVSSDLFEDILQEEEGHVDHIETMLNQIDLIGIENFIQLHIKPAGGE